MFETTCLSEVVAHWRFCLIDSKSLGYLCCGFEGRSMKRIKTCCKLHFFVKGYSHDNWMAFILERVHVISNKWTFHFRTSHCGFQCKWMFSMLLAPFCFMLSSLHSFEIFRFIKQLSRRATSFTMSNGEKRVSRFVLLSKKLLKKNSLTTVLFNYNPSSKLQKRLILFPYVNMNSMYKGRPLIMINWLIDNSEICMFI